MKVTDLILIIDEHLGTPCEQIRHSYEVETLQERIAELEAKLAAAEKMREALERLARLGNGDEYGNSIGNIMAQQALKAYEEAGR